MGQQGSSLIKMTFDLEDMEISGGDNKVRFPIFETTIIELIDNCDSLKECHVGHSQMGLEEFFPQIHELNPQYFYRCHSFNPFEIHKEHSIV